MVEGCACVFESTPLPCALELAADVVHRDAADDGPAMRAEVWRTRLREIANEALHLLACQGRVGLHRRPTRHERERAIDGRGAGLRAAELVDGGLQQPPRLVALEQRGD